MKSQSSYATQILSGLFISSTLLLSACGAVKSGFHSDPLAGNTRYQEMRKEGVPQTQPVAGEGNTATPGVQTPVNSETVPPVDNSGATTPVDSQPAPSVKVPSVESAPVPVAAIETHKLTIGEIPLPETQVINFVEGIALKYKITITKSNGQATAKGLPDGVKLTPVKDDRYEMTWTAPVGITKDQGAFSMPIVINVGENRQHVLAIAVSPSNAVPFVRKVTLNAAEVKVGEAVGFNAIISAKGTDASALRIALDGEQTASPAVLAIIQAADLKAAVQQSETTYLVHGTFQTKTLPADTKTPLKLSFIVTAIAGDKESAQISQTIIVNPSAKVVEDAKADATTAKKATVAQKKTVKKTTAKTTTKKSAK